VITPAGEEGPVPISSLRHLAEAVARQYGDKGAIVLSYGSDGLRIGIDGLSRAEAERALCVAIYYAVLFADQELSSWEIM